MSCFFNFSRQYYAHKISCEILFRKKSIKRCDHRRVRVCTAKLHVNHQKRLGRLNKIRFHGHDQAKRLAFLGGLRMTVGAIMRRLGLTRGGIPATPRVGYTPGTSRAVSTKHMHRQGCVETIGETRRARSPDACRPDVPLKGPRKFPRVLEAALASWTICTCLKHAKCHLFLLFSFSAPSAYLY